MSMNLFVDEIVIDAFVLIGGVLVLMACEGCGACGVLGVVHDWAVSVALILLVVAGAVIVLKECQK